MRTPSSLRSYLAKLNQSSGKGARSWVRELWYPGARGRWRTRTLELWSHEFQSSEEPELWYNQCPTQSFLNLNPDWARVQVRIQLEPNSEFESSIVREIIQHWVWSLANFWDIELFNFGFMSSILGELLNRGTIELCDQEFDSWQCQSKIPGIEHHDHHRKPLRTIHCKISFNLPIE